MEGSSTEPVRHCFLETPIGRLRLAGDRTSLREISFPNRVPAAQSRDEHPGVPLEAPLREAARQLEAYFAGELDRFDLPLAPEGTAFQKEVWALLREIPYGETSSYGSLARRLGRPAASRAVGAANGRNPIPIVIPCHRVVGADGSLTGFGGGLPIKRQLLALEAIHCIALRSRSVAGP
ncbi:MAG: methylated-DNA--[protein]-cysteine S-methyltransferase [Acidobacteriota bacterium]